MSTEKRGGRSSGKRSKSVREKAGDPAAGVPAAGDPAAGGDRLKETAAKPEDGGKTAPPAGPGAKRKISLPAYGFANDLLKSKEASAGEAPAASAGKAGKADEAAGKADKAAGKADKAAAGKADKAAGKADKAAGKAGEEASGKSSATPPRDRGEADARAEDRVFTFADGLESESEEAAPAPVRLETWVSFNLAGETFALPVDPVHEVVRPSSITRVPHAPFPIRGVTNLRGRVVPVIDLRIRLELPEGEITRASRIVVVGSRGRRLGLLVDAVYQVVHIDLDRVQPPPDDVMTVQSDYISGVYHLGEELVLLLDVDRVLIIKEPDPPGPMPPSAATGSEGAPERPGSDAR